jgi:hypothetical protein
MFKYGRAQFMSRRGITAFVVAVVMVVVTVTGCSKGPTRSASSHAAVLPGAATTTTAVPRLRNVAVLSRTYRLSPSGPLPKPQTVRLPLTRQVPSGWAVVVATAENSGGPWSYLPATLSADRRTAIFTTTRHSIFTVIGENLGSLLGFFKTQFLDGLSSEATAEASRPSCPNRSAAGAGYTVQSSSGSTVFWCFGMDASGQRILRVVNNRLYPLEIQHPGLSAVERPSIDYGSLASLSHRLSGRLSIVAPGGEIGYRVDLAPGQSAGAETAIDGFGQSLFALQTAVNTLLVILTRFGAGSESTAINITNEALGKVNCADALFGGNPGSILASCLDPTEMAEYFGTVGVLLAPLAATGGLADFFASEFQALHDTWTHDDQYTIVLRRAAAVPVLGQPVGDFKNGQGWGEVRPATVFNGGDPTGLVAHITWSSWGGSTAVGTGTSDYVGPNQFVATGTQEPVTIAAFDLGTCDGKLMYRAVEWYFPQHGQAFNPSQYENICTGTYVGE